MEENINSVVDVLKQIESDITVPKNVRIKIKNAVIALAENGKSLAVRIDKSLQELDDLSDNPNVPVYTRTQIWNVVSVLESLE